ncbi:hypothetical protein [Bradyrhizobium sp. 35]|uniref:hypothetical protein n=1 Tax=Bradyrhizobium sp. 35 TaxID=2782670 RepID=UPI001FFAC33A|nr:hypothetical protein [Bradyrhizobium sp. 35]
MAGPDIAFRLERAPARRRPGQFDKFSECLAAEEQMRKHYADAFEAWDRWAAANIERRREYSKVRDLQAKRLLSNIGTCVPHAGGRSARRRRSSAAGHDAIPAAAGSATFADAGAKPTDITLEDQHSWNARGSNSR